MKFFLDNNLPPKLAQMLRVDEVDVVHLSDVYPRNVADEVWIPDVAKKKWVTITHDRKILVRPSEKAALLAAGSTIIFVKGGVQKYTLRKQLAFFLEHWDSAVAAAESAKPHKCWFMWQQNGRVKDYEE